MTPSSVLSPNKRNNGEFVPVNSSNIPKPAFRGVMIRGGVMEGGDATVSDFHSAPKLFVDKHHPMRHKGPAARKPKTRSIAFGHIELDNRTAGYHGRGPDPSSTALVVHPSSHSHSHSSSSSSHSSKMPMIGRTKTKSLRIKGGNKTQSGPHYPWMADPNNPDTQSGRRKTHVGGGMSNKAYEKILADTVQSMQNQLNDVIKENETLKKANTSHLIELDAVSDEMERLSSDVNEYHFKNELMSKELQDLHHKLRHDRDARNLAVVQAKEILMAKDRIESKIKELQSEVEQRESDVLQLKKTMKHDKRSRKHLEKDYHVLKKVFNGLKAEHKLCGMRENTQKGDLSAAGDKSKELRLTLEKLKTDLYDSGKAHEKAMRTMQADMDVLEQEHMSRGNTVSVLRRDHTEMSEKLEIANATISRLESELRDAKDALERELLS